MVLNLTCNKYNKKYDKAINSIKSSYSLDLKLTSPRELRVNYI